MKGYKLTVERLIRASPEVIFDVLADPAKHSLIDGSGMLQGANDAGATRLALGVTFGMGMKMGVRYSTVNTVVEFEENRLIAWQTGPKGQAGALRGGTDLALRARTPGRPHAGAGELGHHRRSPKGPAAAWRHLFEEDPSGHGTDLGPPRRVGDRALIQENDPPRGPMGVTEVEASTRIKSSSSQLDYSRLRRPCGLVKLVGTGAPLGTTFGHEVG